MEKAPLFSIIIPVYKVEKYLEECVKSVLIQDYSNFEIILIDDGSPDKCSHICDRLSASDNRIKVIHKKNEGVSAARKDGVNCAVGKYIVCVDADDLIKQGLLSMSAKVIQEQHPDMIYYGMIPDKKDKNTDTTQYREGYYSKKEIEKKIFPMLIQTADAKYFAPGVWGKIVIKDLFMQNILSNKDATIGEDGACIIPCIYHASSFFVMNEKFYYYRYNESSSTKGHKVFNWNCAKIVNKHIMSKMNMKAFDFKEQMYRKVAHDFFNTAITQFYSGKRYKDVKSDILEHMQDEFYNTAISKAKFKRSLKADIMMMSLKRKWILLMWIYARVK